MSLLIPKINYTIKNHPKAKRMRITIYQSGEVIVTKPPRASKRTLNEFIHTHSEWIEKTIQEWGNGLQINPKTEEKRYKKYKKQARALVLQKLEHFNQFYGFTYNKIAIRNQKTRWGSCSSQGNLNFNYKIIFLPERLCDYLIVHELCHLKELNHSNKFWSLVAKTLPEYQKLKQELKNTNPYSI